MPGIPLLRSTNCQEIRSHNSHRHLWLRFRHCRPQGKSMRSGVRQNCFLTLTSYVTLSKPFPSPSLSSLIGKDQQLRVPSAACRIGLRAGAPTLELLGLLLTTSEGDSGVKWTWRYPENHGVQGLWARPSLYPVWTSFSVRVLQESHKIPGYFCLIYLFKRPCPPETYNLVEKTSFQNDLLSRCTCTSVISPT